MQKKRQVEADSKWIPKKISILGADYEISVKTLEEDPDLKNRYGYIWYRMKQIVLRDLYRDPEWKEEPDVLKKQNMQECLRHEITHGFLFESGLAESSFVNPNGWAKNEEMVDWFALQSPKIFKAFRLAGCL